MRGGGGGGELIRAGVFIRISMVICLFHFKKGMLWDVIGCHLIAK